LRRLAERCGDPYRWPEILDRLILGAADGEGR
jgi:hypothetical protein